MRPITFRDIFCRSFGIFIRRGLRNMKPAEIKVYWLRKHINLAYFLSLFLILLLAFLCYLAISLIRDDTVALALLIFILVCIQILYCMVSWWIIKKKGQKGTCLILSLIPPVSLFAWAFYILMENKNEPFEDILEKYNKSGGGGGCSHYEH